MKIISYLLVSLLVIYLYSCNQNYGEKLKGYKLENNIHGNLLKFYGIKDSIKDGPYFEFFNNNRIKYYADFKNDKIKGTFLELDTSGTIRTVCNAGKILKVCTDYYLNGKIKSSGGFLDEKKFGPFNFFDTTGNLNKTINYYNDTINGNVFYYNNNKIIKYYLVNNTEAIYATEYEDFTVTREDIKTNYFFIIDTIINKKAILLYYINPPHRKIKVYQKHEDNWNSLNSITNPLIFPFNDITNVNLNLRIVAVYNNDSIENEISFISENLLKLKDFP